MIPQRFKAPRFAEESAWVSSATLCSLTASILAGVIIAAVFWCGIERGMHRVLAFGRNPI